MLNGIDLFRIDLNLLTLFETVIEERHVGRAAARIRISPSAVSHGLARLRRTLNDPLFLKHPKGVVPTARALELVEPVGEILARVRSVVAASAPFDPQSSARRFLVGAVDGIAATILPALLAQIARGAPRIDIGVRSLFPQEAPAALDSRTVDVALVPDLAVPARFLGRDLYAEKFVIATRAGHPFGPQPTLDAYCAANHLLVATGVSTRGFIDDALAERGLQRRVALTVPTFMWALAAIAETDLVGAVPQRLIMRHGRRFGVVAAELPIPLPSDRIIALYPKAAAADAGLAWLVDRIAESAG